MTASGSRILPLGIAVLISMGCASSGSRESAPDRGRGAGHPEAREPRTPEDHARLVGYFPNTSLTASDGSTFHFYEDLVRKKRVLINFMYTSCEDR